MSTTFPIHRHKCTHTKPYALQVTTSTSSSGTHQLDWKRVVYCNKLDAARRGGFLRKAFRSQYIYELAFNRCTLAAAQQPVPNRMKPMIQWLLQADQWPPPPQKLIWLEKRSCAVWFNQMVLFAANADDLLLIPLNPNTITGNLSGCCCYCCLLFSVLKLLYYQSVMRDHWTIWNSGETHSQLQFNSTGLLH